MKRVHIAFFLAFLLSVQVFAVTASADTAPKMSTWAKEPISEAIKAGYVVEGQFTDYTAPITRADFCRLAVAWIEFVFDEPVATLVEQHHIVREYGRVFSDTEDDTISYAYALHIINGIEAPTPTKLGIFSPDSFITRQEAAVMLRNTCHAALLDLSTQKPVQDFSDEADVSDWAKSSVDFVHANGIMNGVEGNRFLPRAGYTVEQAITTFSRLVLMFDVVHDPVPLSEFSGAKRYEEQDESYKFEREVFRLINEIRVENGLNALVWDDRLAAAARLHCYDMYERDYYAHESPEGVRAIERANNQGYRGHFVGENLVKGSPTPERAVAAWMNSEPHRINLLFEDYVDTGIGCCLDGNFIAQVFGAEH